MWNDSVPRTLSSGFKRMLSSHQVWLETDGKAGARLKMVSWYMPGENVRGANFTRALLCGVDFGHSDLSGACFKSADLTDAKLFDACIDGADFTGADVTGAIFLCRNCKQRTLAHVQVGAKEKCTRMPGYYDPFDGYATR